MSKAHLHLLITHLPIFGSIIGALILGYGLWTKSNHTKNAASFIFIISAIGAGIAYLTGEGAEEGVENIQGVAEKLIKIHEDAALYALISLIALGVLSMIALVVRRFKPAMVKTTSILLFLLSLISFGLVERTVYLGVQMRHTEIYTSAVQNNAGG